VFRVNKKKGGAAAVKRRLPRHSLMGMILVPFPRVWNIQAPVIERPCRPAYRRVQAVFSAKNAPFLYSSALALVGEELTDAPARFISGVVFYDVQYYHVPGVRRVTLRRGHAVAVYLLPAPRLP